MTIKQAKDACKTLNHRLTWNSDYQEFRLTAIWCKNPDHGYYTNDREDAINTAIRQATALQFCCEKGNE